LSMEKYDCFELEPQLRSKGGAKVVRVSAVNELDLIAGFSAEGNAADIKVHTAPGVERPDLVSVHEIAELVVDGSRRHRPADGIIHQASLGQGEESRPPEGEVNLGPKQGVQRAHIGAHAVGYAAHGNGPGLRLLEVVGHLPFQHDSSLD